MATATVTTFHRWISTDSDSEDQCLACGVVTPDQGEGVLSDHGPLPLACPGPDVKRPHHFIPAVHGIECAYCLSSLTDDSEGVEWECAS